MLLFPLPNRKRFRGLISALLGCAVVGSAQAQCPVVLTHSGANFSGGTFVIQAGMAEGEAGAASFTLQPSAFPIKINLAECIFAQQNATATTTVWEVFFYDGTPDTGTLVASYTSDDVILPHLRIPAGTNGTNVQFSIDPNDPEQLYINNITGTNTFSVGYRIVQHNSPGAPPDCGTAPSTQNAFMTTDANGLQQPARNWLDANNCGAFGAPPGWHSFSQLSSIFRPTGDWNIRVTYESTNPLTITDQPDSQTIQLGQPAIFQVVASGSGPFTYQWYKGTTQINNSSRIFGATTDTLMIFPTQASDEATNYRVVVSGPCGTVTSQDAALSFAGLPVSGNVILQDWVASRAGQSVALEFYSTGGTLLGARTVTLDSNGNYTSSLPTGVGAGTYNIFAVGSHWLKKLRANVAVSGSGATGVNFSLVNGDVDMNNEVGPGDFAQLAAAFGTLSGDTNWNPMADLDGDAEVGPSDFSILATNFGEAGD